MSYNTIPKVPLGEVPEPESGVALVALSATKMTTLTVNSTNAQSFIRVGHVVQMAYAGGAYIPGAIQKTQALRKSGAEYCMILGVAVTDFKVLPGQSAFINATDISFPAADAGRVTYKTRGTFYLRVDPLAVTTPLVVGSEVEISELEDSAGDSTYSNQYRFGTVCHATDNDDEHLRVGWALEAEQTYIPFDTQDYDYNAGVGIGVVKTLLDIDHTPTEVATT